MGDYDYCNILILGNPHCTMTTYQAPAESVNHVFIDVAVNHNMPTPFTTTSPFTITAIFSSRSSHTVIVTMVHIRMVFFHYASFFSNSLAQVVKGNFLKPERGWKCVLAFYAFDDNVPGSNRLVGSYSLRLTIDLLVATYSIISQHPILSYMPDTRAG